tara:strand:+ start:373 stop:648 length:276 start_codon:yes stop_codon:yes gene_type:complete
MNTKVTMTCMTTKQKFDIENPDVIILKNGRFAYKCRCPWDGKNGKQLYAFKFCSRKAYEDSHTQIERPESPEQDQLLHTPESPEAEMERTE